MKVLFLSQIVPYPPHGGVLQRGYNLLRELGREARVHLLAFVHPDVLGTEALLHESRTTLEKFCESVEYFPLWPKVSSGARMAAVAVSAMASQPFSVIAHRSASFQRRVSESVARGKFDLVHADTIALAQFVEPRGRLPTVLTHHNVESQLMGRRAQAESHWFGRWFIGREAEKLATYEREVCSRFDVNIVVSRNDEQTLSHLVPGVRTAVVPNGVDIEYFSPSSGSESDTLIYTGGMNMFANRDAVLFFLREMWPIIVAHRPGAKFFAIGQDPPKDLIEFAEKDSRVVVTGYVDDIRPFVRKAAVYVVPLRVGGGTRLKVLDAMAMGKAMVSTSIGCEGIAADAGEHLRIADTPEEFAQETLALMADASQRDRLGKAARTLVEARYAWRTIGGQLMAAYQQACVHAEQSR